MLWHAVAVHFKHTARHASCLQGAPRPAAAQPDRAGALVCGRLQQGSMLQTSRQQGCPPCSRGSLRGAHSSSHPLSSSLRLSCLALRPEPRASLQLRRQLQGAAKLMICHRAGCPQAPAMLRLAAATHNSWLTSMFAGSSPRCDGLVTGPHLPALPSSLAMLHTERMIGTTE